MDVDMPGAHRSVGPQLARGRGTVFLVRDHALGFVHQSLIVLCFRLHYKASVFFVLFEGLQGLQ